MIAHYIDGKKLVQADEFMYLNEVFGKEKNIDGEIVRCKYRGKAITCDCCEK